MIRYRPFLNLVPVPNIPNYFILSVIVNQGVEYKVKGIPRIRQTSGTKQIDVDITLEKRDEIVLVDDIFPWSEPIVVRQNDHVHVKVREVNNSLPDDEYAFSIHFEDNMHNGFGWRPHLYLQHLNKNETDEVFVVHTVVPDDCTRAISSKGAPSCSGDLRTMEFNLGSGSNCGLDNYHEPSPIYQFYPGELCSDENKLNCIVSDAFKEGNVIVRHADGDDKPVPWD